MIRRVPITLRWAGCFVAALGIHIAGAAVLLSHWQPESDQLANAPVVMIDLAPIAVAPQTVQTDMPPDAVERQFQAGEEETPDKPEEEVVEKPRPPEPEKPIEIAKSEPQPEPEKKSEVEPEPAKAEIAMLPPPRPAEKIEDKKEEKKKEVRKKPKPRPASLASAPSAADQVAPRPAAPNAGAARDSNALPNWTSRVLSRLERYKRYPSEAQSRGDRGVVRLAFSVDRSGGVHNARVVASSGSNVLDRETLAMIERAAPLPPPPDEVRGSHIPVVVPISYSIR
ncbi:MAG TPA: energy transducer TonB [Kaistia sp.]|nr:energy transducer TonB [Kaistia sp.]HWK94461.1 energy transducer TonB [Pseudolabrys sp.]